MLTLEIAANLAEIIAGLAIVGAAIKAWPIFTSVEARLGKKRGPRGETLPDRQRLVSAMQTMIGVTCPPDDPKVILKTLLANLGEADAYDVHFEYYPSREPQPGVIRLTCNNPAEGITRPELVSLSADGYQELYSALRDLAAEEAGLADDQGYITAGSLRLIVQFTRSISGPLATLRVTPGTPLQIEDLALDRADWWPIVKPLIEGERPGVVICAGPIGSGKSTTASSLVSYSQRPAASRVVSAEDPVEFLVAGVLQLSSEGGEPFRSVFDRAVRQNPTVLFIGNREPGEFIWDAYGSENQSTVINCVNALDAAAALELIVRQGGDRVKSIDAPMIILGQHLFWRLCHNCRLPADISKNDEEKFAAIQAEHANHPLPQVMGSKFSERGPGCDACQAGQRGRTAIQEALDVTQSLMGTTPLARSDIRRQAIDAGMASLQLNLLSLVSRGEIALADLKSTSRILGCTTTWDN